MAKFRKGRSGALAADRSSVLTSAGRFPGPLEPSAVTEVTTEVGQLYVHTDDQVMTPWIDARGEWEADETAFLRRSLRPGNTFVDVGANIGYFSVLGSTLVGASGRVVAVEPEPRNLSLLSANLWRHRCENALVLPVAAHRQHGFLPLRMNEENRGDHQVGWAEEADLLVPCARLDDLLRDVEPDLIKVDTQGVDHDVIAGLAEVIAENLSLTILVEFWLEGMEQRGLNAHQIAAEYEASGFRLAQLETDGGVRESSPEELVAGAAASPSHYVNVVLHRA